MEELIYDRTQSDVDNKTSKGYHNISDLNRIESACEEIAGLLRNYGYPVSITCKTNWAMTDIRYASEMERIRSNIGKIKDAYYTLTSTPVLPDTLNKIDIQKANAIEKILYDIDELINGVKDNWKYSGDVISGEGYFSD